MIGQTMLDPVICLLNSRQSLNPASTKDTLSARATRRGEKKSGIFICVLQWMGSLGEIRQKSWYKFRSLHLTWLMGFLRCSGLLALMYLWNNLWWWSEQFSNGSKTLWRVWKTFTPSSIVHEFALYPQELLVVCYIILFCSYQYLSTFHFLPT